MGTIREDLYKDIAEYFAISAEELLKRYPRLGGMRIYQVREVKKMFDEYYKELEDEGAFGPGA